MRTTQSKKQISNYNDHTHVYELALANGEDLDDGSLLEVILSRHFDEADTKRITRKLLQKFRRLGNVLHSDLHSLLSVEGLTLNAAMAIVRTRQLTRALCRAEVRNCVLLDSHSRIVKYCQALLAGAEREEFHALFLNKRGELLREECLQRGTIDHVSVYPRELLKFAIRYNASFVILVHNHPVGKAEPSRADIRMTQELCRLLNAVGASVFDHIIVSSGDAFSFRKDGATGGNNALDCADMFCR